jgi:hypothetical protein
MHPGASDRFQDGLAEVVTRYPGHQLRAALMDYPTLHEVLRDIHSHERVMLTEQYGSANRNEMFYPSGTLQLSGVRPGWVPLVEGKPLPAWVAAIQDERGCMIGSIHFHPEQTEVVTCTGVQAAYFFLTGEVPVTWNLARSLRDRHRKAAWNF